MIYILWFIQKHKKGFSFDFYLHVRANDEINWQGTPFLKPL